MSEKLKVTLLLESMPFVIILAGLGLFRLFSGESNGFPPFSLVLIIAFVIMVTYQIVYRLRPQWKQKKEQDGLEMLLTLVVMASLFLADMLWRNFPANVFEFALLTLAVYLLTIGRIFYLEFRANK